MTTSNDRHAFEACTELLMLRKAAEDVPSRLQSRFGSAGAMLSAGDRLMICCGLRRHDALLLSRIPELARYIEHTSCGPHPQIGRLPLAAAYLATNYTGLQTEHFYMLCLDSRGMLTACVRLNTGTGDSVLFDLRKLLSEVVQRTPHAVILSHNHPRGTLQPSQDDINCTQETILALSSVGIPLLDHIIIAGREAVSLRDNGFLPADTWLGQSPDHRLLKNWLN